MYYLHARLTNCPKLDLVPCANAPGPSRSRSKVAKADDFAHRLFAVVLPPSEVLSFSGALKAPWMDVLASEIFSWPTEE